MQHATKPSNVSGPIYATHIHLCHGFKIINAYPTLCCPIPPGRPLLPFSSCLLFPDVLSFTSNQPGIMQAWMATDRRFVRRHAALGGSCGCRRRTPTSRNSLAISPPQSTTTSPCLWHHAFSSAHHPLG